MNKSELTEALVTKTELTKATAGRTFVDFGHL